MSSVTESAERQAAAGEDRLRSVWGAYPPLDAGDADARLQAPHPAWQLTLGGNIVAANLLVLWLWGPAPPGGPGTPGADLPNPAWLRGASVFDVVARNLSRLPTKQNHDFLAALASVEQAISPSGEPSLFRRAMLAHPERRHIYEGAGPVLPTKLWEHVLRIASPGEATVERLLEFRTTVAAVVYRGEPWGYVTRYIPLRETRQAVDEQHKRLVARGGAGPYVYRYNVPRPPRPGDEAESKLVDAEQPPVTLYADDSDAGRAAAAALMEAEVPFRTCPLPAGGVVAAEFGGLRFEQVDGVRRLAAALRDMGDVFAREVRKAYPHLFRT